MNCENCGRLLKSADAECIHCAADLRRSPAFTYAVDPADIADEGPYACPACGKHFEQRVEVLLPATAPWWRIQNNVLGCPHCKTALRWVRHSEPSREFLWWQRVTVGALMGALMTLGSAGRLAVELWWPGQMLLVGGLLFMVFAVVLSLGGFSQDAYRQPPKGDGHYAVMQVNDKLGPAFTLTGLVMLVLSSALFFVAKPLIPYAWTLMALVGVFGSALSIGIDLRSRRKVSDGFKMK